MLTLSQKIQDEWTIGRAAADFLIARGITQYEQIENVLHPLSNIHVYAPYIPNWAESLDCFDIGIKQGHKFGVFGDYDCDGTTSSVMVTKYLHARGLETHNLFASRKSGYGFHEVAAIEFVKEDCKTAVILDCGSNNLKSLDILRANGVAYVVLDHHNIEGNPSGYGVVNPQLNEDEDESHSLCAGALTYLFLKAHGPVPEYFKTLAALATVADCSNLSTRLNRAICLEGFQIQHSKMPKGLQYLMTEQAKPYLCSHTAGWGVNPIINAAGRMKKERAAFYLLMADEDHLAAEHLEDLLEINKERKKLQDKILKDIEKGIEGSCDPVIFNGENILVVQGDWDAPGVLGVAASRLCGNHDKIAIVQGAVGGSGRVPDRFSGEVFGCLKKHLKNIAGHNKAFGTAVDRADVTETLDKELSEHVISTSTFDIDKENYSRVEWWEFRNDLKCMDPFGKGFELPRVLDGGIVTEFNPWRW